MTETTQGPSEPTLEVENLTLAEEQQFQLDINNLLVKRGDIFGIVGSNGSGKTSLIEAIFGLRKRQYGKVKLFGEDFVEGNARLSHLRNLGIQLQNVSYPQSYKVKELVDLHQCIYRVADKKVTTMLGIDELKHNSYNKLSRGQKQRVDLYIAMAHSPDLLVLDEPSTGLDHVYKCAFSELLTERNENSQFTTIISTHTGDEAIACNRILWLKDGKKFKLLGAENATRIPIIGKKIRLTYQAPKKDELINTLSTSSELSFFAEDGFGSLIALGMNLTKIFQKLKASSSVDSIELADATGAEFLKVVAEASC